MDGLSPSVGQGDPGFSRNEHHRVRTGHGTLIADSHGRAALFLNKNLLRVMVHVEWELPCYVWQTSSDFTAESLMANVGNLMANDWEGHGFSRAAQDPNQRALAAGVCSCIATFLTPSIKTSYRLKSTFMWAII